MTEGKPVPGSFGLGLGDPVLSLFPGRSGQDVEGDLAISLFLSNFVHYFKQSENCRRRGGGTLFEKLYVFVPI